VHQHIVNKNVLTTRSEAVDDQMSCPISSVVIQLHRLDAANIINVSQEMPGSALPTVTIVPSTAAEV